MKEIKTEKYIVGKFGKFLINDKINIAKIEKYDYGDLYIERDESINDGYRKKWVIWSEEKGIWKDHIFLGYVKNTFEI